MTQTITEKLLEVLQDGAEHAVDLFYTMSTSKSVSHQRLRLSMRYGPRRFKSDWAEMYSRRKSYHALLNRLKKDGLVKKENGRNALWSITKFGKKKLAFMKKRRGSLFSAQNTYFEKGDEGQTIVAFDIPEKEKNKRRWIRDSLRLAGFRLLQKSVWIGNSGLSVEFIDAIRERGLLARVHIFGVRREGTIEKK